MTNVILLCGGEGQRWNGYLGVPKHLIRIDGTTLIERIASQIASRIDANIFIASRDPNMKVDGTTGFYPEYPDDAADEYKFLSSEPLWGKGRTILIFGDVFFTEEAMDQICDPSDGIAWYGRLSPSRLTGKQYGELFALSFHDADHERLQAAIQSINQQYASQAIPRCGGWEVYQQLNQLDPKMRQQTESLRVIDDFTEDFDAPEDYDRWFERHQAWQEIRGASISLCVIARDAETTLPKMLRSVKPFVEEMVVVDTGSTDRTVEVAREIGARVESFPWCDDFSAARNHSIECATCDWVFWMDADDLLPAESGVEINRLVSVTPDKKTAFIAAVEEEMQAGGTSKTESTAHIRLFPRHPDIRFDYRVHEQVTESIERAGLAIATSRLRVIHASADRSPQANEARYARNIRLLQRDLEDRPNDPWVLLNIGRLTSYRPEQAAEAMSYFDRAAECLDLESETDRIMHLNIRLSQASVLERTGDGARTLATLQAAYEDHPRDAALLFRLGDLCQRTQQVALAAKYFSELACDGQVNPAVFQVKDAISQAALRAGDIFMKQRQFEQAEQMWKSCLQRSPQLWQVRRALVQHLIRRQRPDEADQYIESFRLESPQLEAIKYALSGCTAVLRENWRQALRDLTASYKAGYRDVMQLHGLSVALLASNQFKAAENVLQELLRRAPRHPHAMRNMLYVYKATGRTQEAERLEAALAQNLPSQ